MAKFDHTAFRAPAQPVSNPLSPAEADQLRTALLRRLWADHNPDGSAC